MQVRAMDAWIDCKQCKAAVPVGAKRCLKCGMRYPKGARAGIGKSLLIRLAVGIAWLVYFTIIYAMLGLTAGGIITLATFLIVADFYAYRRRTE
jgi:ribosomal protein L40E